MISWALTAALVLSNATAGATIDAATVPLPSVLPAIDQVMAVPVELRTRLQQQVALPDATPNEKLQRLLDLLTRAEPEGLGMQYRDDATLTVEQSWQQRQANCVSFTLMFLALAQLVQLDAYPQEIEETLAWQQHDDVVYRTNHVNAAVRIGGHVHTVDVGRDFVIARFPPHRITLQRALAQYYNNRAATLMIAHELDAALAHARIALALDPAYPTSWSNTGVIRLHGGDATGAEHDYAAALSLDPDNPAALFNLVSLYRRTGEPVKEASYRKRLEKVERVDPFHQFLTAVDYEKKGDATLAIKYYRRAIRLFGTEHRFYAGLARACVLKGDIRAARRAYEHALALSKDDTTRAFYRVQLKSLEPPDH